MGHKVINRRDEGRAAAGNGSSGASPHQVKSSWGFYPTPRYSGQDYYRPRPFMAQTSPKGGLSAFDRWEIMIFGKQLFSQLGHCAAAVLQKNSWAVGEGWDPVFIGNNESWGEEVGIWLREQWYPNCNVLGEVFDFKTTLFLCGLAWDVDGDDGMITTETDNGWPQISIIPCQRIGGMTRAAETVDGGLFDGARIIDGIIYDRNGRMIGARVTDEIGTTTVGTDAGYQDIPAYNFQLMFEPEWSDQGRGISRFGRPILDVMDGQDIDTFLKRAVKMDASQGIIHWTDTGEPNDGADTVSASQLEIGGAASGDTRKNEIIPQRDYQIKPIAGGEFLYMRANSGEKLEAFKSDRPGTNTEAFIQRLERRIMLGLGWSYDLLDLTAISGAPSRLLKDLAMRTIQDRQKNLKRRALRAVRYAVCKAMKNGRIPAYYGTDGDGDMLKWDFEMPGEISIDTGNDEAADRENLKIGSMTLQAIASKKGMGNYKKLTRQSQREILNWAELATEIEAKTAGKINFDKAMEYLTQRTPNGTPLQEMAEDPPTPKPAPQPAKGKKTK